MATRHTDYFAQQPIYCGPLYTSAHYIDVGDEVEKWRPVPAIVWPGWHEVARGHSGLAVLAPTPALLHKFIFIPTDQRELEPIRVKMIDMALLTFKNHHAESFTLVQLNGLSGYVSDQPAPRLASMVPMVYNDEMAHVPFSAMRHDAFMLGFLERLGDTLLEQWEEYRTWGAITMVAASGPGLEFPDEEIDVTPPTAATTSARPRPNAPVLEIPSDW